MKVRVSVTVDVDAEAWALEYGEPCTRENVRSHVTADVIGQLGSLGLLSPDLETA